MPLPSEEPNVTVRNLLANNWDSSNIGETFETAWIGTGWWDEETPNAQITLTNVREPTEPTGMVPDGSGLSSWVDGAMDVNAFVSLDDSYESTGVAKSFRWDLTREIHRIIENNQQGTGSLTRLETGTIRRNPTDPPPPFRMLIPVGFQYRTEPE